MGDESLNSLNRDFLAQINETSVLPWWGNWCVFPEVYPPFPVTEIDSQRLTADEVGREGTLSGGMTGCSGAQRCVSVCA